MIDRKVIPLRGNFLIFLLTLSCSVRASDIWREALGNPESSKIGASTDLINNVQSTEFIDYSHMSGTPETPPTSLKTEDSYNSLESAAFYADDSYNANIRGSFQSDSSEEAAVKKTTTPLTSDQHPSLLEPIPAVLLMTPESERSFSGGRLRASSFARNSNGRRELHVSFNTSQSEEMHTTYPSFDIPDTPENRKALHMKLLKKAERGDFLYFSYLKSVLDNWDSQRRLSSLAVDEESLKTQMNELNPYNEYSLLFKSLHGDNPDIFAMILEWKKIPSSYLHASPRFIESESKSKPAQKARARKPSKSSNFYQNYNRFSPSSYPPKGKSVLDSSSEDSNEEEEEAEEQGQDKIEFINPYNLVRLLDNDADSDDSEIYSDSEERPVDETVFGRAVELDAVKIVRYMIDLGIRDFYEPRNQNSLHLAIVKKREGIVSLLLQHQICNVDQIDGALKTPLMLAIETDNFANVTRLIEANASLIETDIYSRSALHIAAEHGNKNVLNLLSTALHDHYSKEVIQDFINAQDWNGKTAVDLALNSDVRNFILHEIGLSK